MDQAGSATTPVVKALGVGGVFVRARDPAALGRWYADHLGLPIDPAWNGGVLVAEAGDATVLSYNAPGNDYFPTTQPVMMNWRVADVGAAIAALRAAGVRVDDAIQQSEFGTFGWGWDPEGNRFELWQPPAA